MTNIPHDNILIHGMTIYLWRCWGFRLLRPLLDLVLEGEPLAQGQLFRVVGLLQYAAVQVGVILNNSCLDLKYLKFDDKRTS